MVRQAGFPATYIKDLLPCSNDLGDTAEFRPRETRSIQCSVKVAAPIELQVEGLIAGQHRLEEGKSTWRFPQPEMSDVCELTVRRNAKGPSPQSNEQPGADPLNAATGRQSGNGTLRNRLHRQSKITTGAASQWHHTRPCWRLPRPRRRIAALLSRVSSADASWQPTR